MRLIDVLVGQKLDYLRLGHAIVMGFTGGHRVVLESAAHLNGPHGHVVVEPGESPSDVLAVLLGDVVQAAHTRDNGELEITFAGGSELCVGVDADFESWAVAGPDGFLIVCLARGELAVWGAAGAGRAAA
ncbi:DUF6188 family protein [Actinoplanes sp. NEAU-A12]|uniref:DUF6188 family protein n=1 Tax=Actinoplanes sandaracinus TaxID=3045177 RepID=A0ABT6WGD5_9ACTN|nr:DUF6188 family protein [Actinoplanes sandaracinus]MDI6098784.1 DUF6188 family protein [Actinoplanes sandaracinus]